MTRAEYQNAASMCKNIIEKIRPFLKPENRDRPFSELLEEMQRVKRESSK